MSPTTAPSSNAAIRRTRTTRGGTASKSSSPCRNASGMKRGRLALFGYELRDAERISRDAVFRRASGRDRERVGKLAEHGWHRPAVFQLEDHLAGKQHGRAGAVEREPVCG